MKWQAWVAAVVAMAWVSSAWAREPPPADAKRFQVDFTGMVILPSNRPPEPDMPHDYRDKEEVFRAPLGFHSIGKLDAPASFEMFGKPVAIAATDLLNVAVRAKGGDLAQYGKDPVVLCADPQQNFAKSLAAASTLLLSTLLSRFQPWTQVCLADTDRDGAMEHAFMIGTRMPADRRLFPITPVRYTIGRNLPIADGHLSLIFVDPGLLSGASVEAQVWLSGRNVAIDRLYLGADRKEVKSSYGIKAGGPPRTIEIAGSRIMLDRLSADGKVVTARYLDDTTTMDFDYDQHVTYTVIYY